MRSNTCLEVCLSDLEFNLELIRKKSFNKKILLMVKADAYGHGMLEVVQKSYETGVRDFGCASLREAIYLREGLPDLEFDIYIFSELDFEQEHCEHYQNSRLIPVISDLSDLELFLQKSNWKHVPLCLKFNTGMNRLGLSQNDLAKIQSLMNKHERREVFHLMSHFANASLETKEGSFSDRQYSEFLQIKKTFISNGIKVKHSSMANSGAIEQGFACAEETHVRPGIIAYGASSLIPKLRSKFSWEGKLISKLRTRIFRILELKKGDPIGYGSMVVPRDCEVLILPVGYGDGLSRRLEKCSINFGGITARFFGRISMDMSYIMVDDEYRGKLAIGDTVFLWNQEPASLHHLSDQLETISYEILCQLSQRVPRVYRL